MFRLFASISFLFLLTGALLAQETPLNTPSSTAKPQVKNDNPLAKDFGEYNFDLPNATWRVTSKTGETAADLIYGDRMDGYLQIRKVSFAEGTSFADVIDREQNQKLQFLPAFVNGKEENFRGNLNGKVINYEFTQSGRPMSGRVYFLQADNKTVYTLRFTGLSDKLRLMRNQTDSIARTFKLKK